MESFKQRSTAGTRQFEQTAINKLIAKGVPAHIAHAFVCQGLPKSGRVAAVKDVVCKMQYQKFFVERNESDYRNPLRVGSMVPYVHETKIQRFHTEFAMTDIESAKFVKAFPEFEVVSKGKVYNAHSYYANKRYAETELLVMLVNRHAAQHGLDSTSIIDLGGNSSWHAKRNREYVHCDNPVLSARDVMRYKVREMFTSSRTSTACGFTYSDCSLSADYTICVHSTYDLSPKNLAASMRKKSVKQMYGVINYIPGIETKQSGTYESDGIVMEVVRPFREPAYIKCGFAHDPALVYRHELSILKKYLFVRRSYEFSESDGTVSHYLYTIHSVRGNSLVFSISLTADTGLKTNAIWTPPSKKMYYVSLGFLGVDRLELDSEYFDRLVLQAAGARNFQQYDIVSLFRYAKSLRQRVSINGMVLSSGFTHTPEELVYSVIAAYGVAMAYRIESADFFRKASSQIVRLRGQGFIKDAFNIAGTAALSCLLLLPAVISKSVGFSRLDSRIRQLVATSGSITVELYKPHASQGLVYDPSILRKPSHVASQPSLDSPNNTYTSVLFDNLVCTRLYLSYASKYNTSTANVAGVPMCFRSKGLFSYDDSEIPKSINQAIVYDIKKELFSSGLSSFSGLSVPDAKRLCIKALSKRVAGLFATDDQLFTMANGDCVHRLGYSTVGGYRSSNEAGGFVSSANTPYMVFRGFGNKAVVLTKPKMYEKGNCLRFILFYDGAYKYNKNSKKDSILHSDVEVQQFLNSDSGYNDDALDVSSDPDVVDVENVITRRFSSASQGRDFVREKAAQGEYFMSGALQPLSSSVPVTPLPTPPLDESDEVAAVSTVKTLVSEEVASDDLAMAAERDSVDDNADATVLSDDMIPGRPHMEELILSYEEATKVALANAKMVVNLALSVSRDDAPVSKWSATVQGHPGNPRMVRVTEDEEWIDVVNGSPVEHMAITDGDVVFDRLGVPPPVGIYVTSDVLKIFTGSAIKNSVQSVLDDSYSCPVTAMDGVAGSGKSYHISHHAKPGDVVLCETRESLQDVIRDLAAVPGWKGHNYTVDSYLMHCTVRDCDVLWVDEAYRLHAGKIFAIMKLLRPKRVLCFGDSKQIPSLSFIPGFDFLYHKFPFIRTEHNSRTYRCPADVCFGLSTPQYYTTHVVTKNPIMRSLGQPVQYHANVFSGKPDSVPLLVYTQLAKDTWLKNGVKNVKTIGEAQGKTYDDVILFRDDKLDKAIYVDLFQALVALTRHRKSFTYVTADAVLSDKSAVANVLHYVSSKRSDVLLSSHLDGVKGAADASALQLRMRAVSADRSPSVYSLASGEFGDAGQVSRIEELDSDEDWDDDLTREQYKDFNSL